MNNNYAKAYKEVNEILKFVPEESVNKIPKDMRDMFKSKMDIAHHFEIDPSKSLKEHELLEETKAVLAVLYEDYWASAEEKAEIKRKERAELQKAEEEKLKKYNVDVFASYNNNDNAKKQEEAKKTMEAKDLPIEKKEGFAEKIRKFFRGILGK